MAPTSLHNINLTDDQREIFNAITTSRHNFFVTGGAGSGKSYLLHALKYWWNNAGSRLMRANGEIFFTATTGVASTVFGGQTIHSLFGYKFMKEEESIHDVIKCMPSNVKILLKNITPKNTMLIIDEISMLSSNLFQRASDILGELMHTQKCHSPKKPFGGIQIICFGDFLQLAPVVKSLDGKGNRKVVISDFAFSSRAWNNLNFKYCELAGSIRQQSDSKFFNFLNQLRLGLLDNFMKSILRTHFETAESVENPTILYGKNTDVARENFKQFKLLAKIQIPLNL
ncbi:hypothetical protein GEMRC1_006124 [Eukaryota sp. GEM-RC1]